MSRRVLVVTGLAISMSAQLAWLYAEGLPAPGRNTRELGGVSHPSVGVLKQMRRSSYILQARDGRLTRLPVEKTLLPHDPKVTPQGVQAVLANDGTVYVKLASIVCKSIDGGRIWSAHPLGDMDGMMQVLPDGTFVGFSGGKEADEPVIVMRSSDEGRTWSKISEIKPPPGYWGGVNWTLCSGDLLLCALGTINHVFQSVEGRARLVYGGGWLRTLRSANQGKTWTNEARVTDWGSEGGGVKTASGKLLAVIRYQRPMLPGDPPDLEKRTGSTSAGWPYKHVFLADSYDQGVSWKNFRQLTTVFGQTRGYPAALSDGTVVVIHDTRYGPPVRPAVGP